MTSIKKAKDLKGKRVIVRVDFNVPLHNNKVIDDFRIKAVLPTILFLKKNKAKIILISHIGDDASQSLAPVASYIKRKKLFSLTFIPDVIGEKAKQAVVSMKNGEIILLENLRTEAGEKKNDQLFTVALSSFGDVYVNDAFSVSHREHASVVGIPKLLPSYAGISLEKEIQELSKAFSPRHPFFFILGGAKFSTKMPLVKSFADKADIIFLGGTLQNTIIKGLGYQTGKSVVDSIDEHVQEVLKLDSVVHAIDFVVTNGDEKKVVAYDAVSKKDMIVDIGPETTKRLISMLSKAKFVVINGPLGFYERGFVDSTKKILISLSKQKNTRVIIGGGDIVSLVQKFKLTDSFTHVSTGGGATLDFLAHGTLPGIEALS
jgi:phosphoglycerate kinase